MRPTKIISTLVTSFKTLTSCFEVANRNLELPDYRETDQGNIYIYYGEVFCRVPEYAKSRHKYTAINNLCSHLETHKGIRLEGGNNRGQYKGLFSGIKPYNMPAASSVSSIYRESMGYNLPALPKKKDGLDINYYNYFALFNCRNYKKHNNIKKETA
ncbi:hypothetical protein BDW60DRAFT_187954 [Aspergillus nidulans var. acristatus]